MNNFNARLSAFLSRCAVPILLLTVLFSSVIYIYVLGDKVLLIGLTAVSFIYFTLITAGFYFLQNLGKNWVTTVSISAALFLSIIIGSGLIETKMTDTAQWFFEPYKFGKIYTGNIMALLLMVGFVLGAAAYYFTCVRFRTVYVFLICMCPFSLFAKSFTDIPVIFTILIITLFFLLVIAAQIGGSLFSGRNRYVALGLFIAVAAAGAAFLPKLEYAPFREDFDALITGINIGAAEAVDFDSFSDSSSGGGADTEDDETVLYTIYGSNPVYLKRQCFNAYNSENHLWEYYGDVDTGYNNYMRFISWENPASLASEYGLDIPVSREHCIVVSETGPVHALYTPENMTSVEFSFSSQGDYSTKHVYRTPLDEYFHSSEYSYDSYNLTWYDFETDVEFMIFYTDETAEKINGSFSAAYLETKNAMRAYYDPIMTETIRRSCYKSDADYEKIKTLAENITKNCTNDYSKAQAIEQYFKSADYAYDEDFTPNDESIENFIFNTKRGICTDYATAMTLLCREAGLYSRYVEGFLVQNMDADGNYIVTSADMHAFVQVWLDGYGWTNFDPTSSNLYEAFDGTFIIFGAVMLLIVFAVLFIVFALPVISESRFVSKTAKLRGRAQLMILYPRINTIVHRELRLKQGILTVSELKAVVSERFGLDISETADDFEKSAYGNIDCGNKNYIEAYIGLKKSIKEAKKKK